MNVATTDIHHTYFKILNERGLKTLSSPLWRLRISDEEYESLCNSLREAEQTGALGRLVPEAAICYAEWWRRSYHGGSPSKEVIASDLGISNAKELFLTACKAISLFKLPMIRTTRNEYFRTLLCQGGLPLHHITTGNNLSNYKNFLKSLVTELASMNVDWNDMNSSVVQSMNCVSYLPSSFQNESIFDISLQVAHAIMENNNEYLPYDTNEQTLGDLTSALKKEYKRAKNQIGTKPFSLSWKLDTGIGSDYSLLYSFDVVKEISSKSLPGIDINNCYSFDVIIDNKVVAKYSRSRYEENPDTGERNVAIYSHINLGAPKAFIWKGEPVVEVKLRCDDDKRLFLSIPGSCAPDFSSPQLFQLISGTLYSKTPTANSENNIVVFSQNWACDNRYPVKLATQDLFAAEFTKDITLTRTDTGELVYLQNKFTPYTVEFSDTYLSWFESSNYHLCTKAPFIRVYDGEKNLVQNFKSMWRTGFIQSWRALRSGTRLPLGLVEIKVIFPDDNFGTFAFYNIGSISISPLQSTSQKVTMKVDGSEGITIHPTQGAGYTISSSEDGSWSFTKSGEWNNNALTCVFEFVKVGEPLLRIEVQLPFYGTSLIDSQGKEVKNGSFLPYSDLHRYKLVSFGHHTIMDVRCSGGGNSDERSIAIKSTILDGVVPLSDYVEVIDRISSLYGQDMAEGRFSILISLCGKVFHISPFAYCFHNLDEGGIAIAEIGKSQEEVYPEDDYDEVLICPLTEDRTVDTYQVYSLDKLEDGTFALPQDYPFRHGLVFSNVNAVHRAVPLRITDPDWNDDYEKIANALENDTIDESSWGMACKSFAIASKYYIPFSYFTDMKVIANNERLFAKFVAALLYNGHKDLLIQEIDRFEKEFNVGLHWIKQSVWAETLSLYTDLFIRIDPSLIPLSLSSFIEFLKDLYTVTLGPEAASPFLSMISSGRGIAAKPFGRSEIQYFRSRVIGLTDNNKDLPTSAFRLWLTESAYFPLVDMTDSQKTMITGTLYVAENIFGIAVDDIWDTSENTLNSRRVINFYRQYFKSTYAEILMRGLGIIASSNKAK